MIKRYWKEIAGLVIFSAAIVWGLIDVYGSHVAANIATIVGAIFAALGLAGIYWQLHSNAVQAKRVRTYDLVSRYYSPEYQEYMFNAAIFLVSDLLPDTKIEQYFNKDNPKFIETRKRCNVLFGYLEDICQMYNMNLLDNDVFERAMGSVVSILYEKAHDIIAEHRIRSKVSGYYKEWQVCAEILDPTLKERLEKKEQARKVGVGN